MTTVAAIDCTKFLAPLKPRVRGAPRPAETGLRVGQALDFADAQTAQLDRANDRGDMAIEIAGVCQAEQARILQALRPAKPWWKVW